MRSRRTLGAIALALLVGLAAPCVRAQHHGGGGGHAPAPRVSTPHPNYHPYANRQAGRGPGGYRAPARAAEPQAGAPMRGQPANNPSAYNPQRSNTIPSMSASAPRTGAIPQSANGEMNASRPATNSQTANGGREMSNLPAKWAANLRDRSPEEQQRFMQNNERFRNLPPAQQAQIRQNLQKWNSLSPTERNAIRDRQETWQRMSPEQRQYVQRTLLPKWQAMSPDRKQLVTGRLHTLQQMSPADRQAALNDPRFMQGLSPDEQSVLRGLDSVRNP
ncbi:MAG: DUF3106 domain-containing protein [Candidatus Acidiferrales bacterium]